jgi:hypothetical protein
MPTENYKRPATKTERIREFVGIVLQEDIIDLRGIPVKEATINLGLGLLMVLVTLLHFILNIWQFVVSLLLVSYDLIARGLAKVMPAPKMAQGDKE